MTRNPYVCAECGDNLADCYCSETNEHNERRQVFADEDERACDDAWPRGSSLPGGYTRRTQ